MPKNDNCLQNGPEKRDRLQGPKGGKVCSLQTEIDENSSDAQKPIVGELIPCALN